MTISIKLSDISQSLIPIDDARWLQGFHFTVSTVDKKEHFLIVNTQPHSLSQNALEDLSNDLRQSSSKETISFYVAEGEGWASVKTTDGEFDVLSLAGAVAVLKASCGWDESSSIVVKINDVEVSASPRFNGNHWNVTSR